MRALAQRTRTAVAGRLDELVAGYRDAGLPVRLEVTGVRSSLPGGVELSVYRIVQEALPERYEHAPGARPGTV